MVEDKRDVNNTNQDFIPYEILKSVFQMLSNEDLENARLVCRNWNFAINSMRNTCNQN